MKHFKHKRNILGYSIKYRILNQGFYYPNAEAVFLNASLMLWLLCCGIRAVMDMVNSSSRHGEMLETVNIMPEPCT